MAYFCPRLEITPNVSYQKITDNIRETKGQIKDELNFNNLMSEPFIHKNNDLVDFFKGTSFVPLPYYYSADVAKIFDVYGGIYDIFKDDVTYTVKLYFYKIKNPELITPTLITNFNLIFIQSYFIECNVLDVDYHAYRLSLFFKELCNPKFLDLTYESHPLCKTKLYCYQRHNITRLLNFHTNGIKTRFNDNLILYLDNGIIYDFTTKKFLLETDIPKNEIYGGIVMDDPGTGKTLQFIVYLLEVILSQQVLNIDNDEKALILVPDNDIKKHWLNEFQKHVIIPFDDLPILLMTMSDFRKYDPYCKADMQFINKIKIVVVDEIHTLWKQFLDVFEKILKYNIKYKWGLTATPFVTEQSLFNVIKFLTGKNFNNERIAHIPRVQNEIMKIFLKNTKFNTKDEYPWPELSINDIKMKFDRIQQDLYDTEAKTATGTYKLRLLACQMELMFNIDVAQSITPKELKQYANNHYKSMYDRELENLEELLKQLKNIHDNREKFGINDYIQRYKHYENLIKQKEEDVKKYKSVYEYYMKSIQKIDSVIAGADVDPDEICPICMCQHETPITYFKNCGHYFCKTCIDEFVSKVYGGSYLNTNIKCPYCRVSITPADILIVKDKCDITASAKCNEIIKLIQSTSDKFIIFTQFPKLIDNLIVVMGRHQINAIKYSTYKTLEEKNCGVIILSSEENAAGIDLTEFNNVIIFEPFEDSTYCREIEKQLIGRVHRHGQLKNVNVYRLIMLNTIEEVIYSKFIT